MLNAEFKIIAYGGPDYAQALRLREEVLRRPLGLSFSEDELAQDKDPAVIHFGGFVDGKLCATALLAAEGKCCKMRRVAVAAAMQGKGLGSALLAFTEQAARARGFQEIYCHARETAVDFYRKHQFLAEGGLFDELGIPHLKMHKLL